MLRSTYVLAILAIAACSQRSPFQPAAVPAPQPQAADVALSRIAVISARPLPVPSVDLDLGEAALTIPVAGIDGSRLDDTFGDGRDGGARRHGAIDIMAPRGTPVLSAQDGRILRLSRSLRGGISIYATDMDEQFVFYYAHLDRYHAGIRAGHRVARGDTIGYVGTTGNAPENAPHLHFQMMRMPADRRYWNGDPINPFPLLTRSAPPTRDE